MEKQRELTSRKFEKIADSLVLAMAAVALDVKRRGLKRGHGGQGEVDCPACGRGKIKYSVASYNGHLAALCSTKRCLRFMQ